MEEGKLGKTYQDGETIVVEGELGDRMFVIQSGKARVTQTKNGKDVSLAVLEDGDFFGEMALIDREVRSATVRALGEVRLLSIDKKNFLKRINEDPSLAFRIVETMSRRIRELNTELARLKGAAAINDGGCNGATGSGPVTVASFSTRRGGPAGRARAGRRRG